MQLESGQELLLTEYMTLYYEALADLRLLDVGALFSDPLQAQASESGAALQTEIRKIQAAAYSLTLLLPMREIIRDMGLRQRWMLLIM